MGDPNNRGLDCRSATTSLNYALLLVVVTLLVAGLLVGVSGFVESQQERAIRSQLDTVGNQLASDIGTANRLVERANGDSVRLRTEIPRSVGGSHYRVEITDLSGNRSRLELYSSDPSVRTTVVVRSSVDVRGTVSGGQVVVEYESSELVVSNA